MMQASVDELGTLETLDGGFPITQSINMHLADAIAVRDVYMCQSVCE